MMHPVDTKKGMTREDLLQAKKKFEPLIKCMNQMATLRNASIDKKVFQELERAIPPHWSKDTIHSTTQIHFSLWDRTRILFGANATVEERIFTENVAGKTEGRAETRVSFKK